MIAVDMVLDPSLAVVFDGAMGTMLYARGVFINQSYDALNLTAPDLVRAIHQEYVQAGAEVIETNTFGANRFKLAAHGLEEKVAAINERAVALAKEAAQGAALVAGAVGPLGVWLEPFGPTSDEEARAVFGEQIAALAKGGVDLLVLETFGDLREIHQALLAARESASRLPVIAQMTINADGRTPFGAVPEDVARALDAWGADIVGLNCSVGPKIMLEAIERMASVTRRKLSAQPNAGLPREVDGRRMYMASPEYMATYARHLLQAGARVVGGCCGTTPEHTRAMTGGIQPLRPKPSIHLAISAETKVSRGSGGPPGAATAPLSGRSRWGAKIAAGEFVSSVEIVPPRGVDASRMLKDVRQLKCAGVAAVNVPDGPRAQSRIGSLLTSVLISQQVGMETVTHYTCRDRNLLGMLSDLLGAAAVGLRNLLLITGDPPRMGPFPNATGVFDIDSIGLTNLVHNLNRGLDPGGNRIGEPTRFVIGVGVNPAAVDLEKELRRFEWKVEAGAEFAITQPVFDPEMLEQFLRRIEHVRIPVVAGIWPLASLRNAEFMANEVPGVSVPEATLTRMRRAHERSAEHAFEEGIAIAREMLAAVRGAVQGVQVSAPLGKVELALRTLEGYCGPALRGPWQNA